MIRTQKEKGFTLRTEFNKGLDIYATSYRNFLRKNSISIRSKQFQTVGERTAINQNQPRAHVSAPGLETVSNRSLAALVGLGHTR